MLIPHDTRIALDTVVDLMNTAAQGDRPDALADLQGLHVFVRAHKISDVGVLDAADLRAVREVREKFAAVFSAPEARIAAP